MNGILESKNDKNEEKRIRVVEIFRVLHLIIYISRVYRKSGTNAEITGYRQLDGSTSYDMYFPEKGCHLGTNRSDNET